LTLLSIIGEDISRIVPLLYAYKKEIREHILLCDDSIGNVERAITLQKGMQRFSLKYNLKWQVRVVKTNEDDANEINSVVKKEFSSKSELWLNVTDGYPAMSILLTRLIHANGGNVLTYDHFDNDLHIIKPDGTMHCEQLNSRMNLDDYIMLLNYSVVEKKVANDLLLRKESILSLYADEKLFYKNREKILQSYFYKRASTMLTPDIKRVLQKLEILDNRGDLIPSKQKVLQGDLFEEYIFWLCESLNPDDIAMGIKIDFDGDVKQPENSKRIFNEFDILMINKNRIYTIECKFSKRLKGLDFVYKYDAILDYFGSSSKAIIANISSTPKERYFNSNSSSSFSHSTLRRARMANMTIYHESYVNEKKFQSLVKNFFNF
jgi:hypothetical protein